MAAPLIAVGVWALLFNGLRYTSLVRGRVSPTRDRLPSSVPFVGSLLVLIGLGIAPIAWHPAFLAVIVLEVFSIDFSAEAAEGSPTSREVPDPQGADETRAKDGKAKDG